MSDTTQFRDLSRLAAAIKVGLVIYAITSALIVWLSWFGLGLLHQLAADEHVSALVLAPHDALRLLIAFIGSISYLVTAVLFLRFTYLAKRNVRAFGTDGLLFSPGWSVGWYFVPFANLWAPYEALKETFKASHPDFTTDWSEAPLPRTILLWWVLWVVSKWPTQLMVQRGLRAETVEDLIAVSRYTIAACTLEIPLCIILIALVVRLHAWQTEKLQRVPSAAQTLAAEEQRPF